MLWQVIITHLNSQHFGLCTYTALGEICAGDTPRPTVYKAESGSRSRVVKFGTAEFLNVFMAGKNWARDSHMHWLEGSVLTHVFET